MRFLRSIRAFTMMEAMIAMTVLGAVLLVAAPTLSGYRTRLQVNSAASELESNLRKARSIAVSKDCNVILVMFADGNGYVMMRSVDETQTYTQFVGQGFFPPHIRFSDVQFGTDTWLNFDPRGVPDNPGFARIYHPDGSGKEVRIATGSGSVSVVEAPPHTGPQS